MKDNILLETGTGEVEILEFLVNNHHFGINVLKIREIVAINDIAPIPGSVKAVVGKMVLRGQVVSVIDLKMVLEGELIEDSKKALGLLCELNQTQVIFMVESVIGIKRFNWKELDNNDKMGGESLAIGTILSGETIITLLDFESILINLSPKNTYYNKVESTGKLLSRRNNMKILLADDSRVVRQMLQDSLEGSGYEHLKFFNNGEEAYHYMMDVKERLGKNFKEEINLLITDIEMPIMDGYTLTRKIKEDSVLSEVPVIIFSSLISDDLYYKGKEVGAEAQISKPSLKRLVAIIDELLEMDYA